MVIIFHCSGKEESADSKLNLLIQSCTFQVFSFSLRRKHRHDRNQLIRGVMGTNNEHHQRGKNSSTCHREKQTAGSSYMQFPLHFQRILLQRNYLSNRRDFFSASQFYMMVFTVGVSCAAQYGIHHVSKTTIKHLSKMTSKMA